MRSLQRNLCDHESGQTLYDTMFVWNEYLTRGIRNNLKNTLWTVALVHGFFNQVWIVKYFNQSFYWIIVIQNQAQGHKRIHIAELI